MVKHYNQLWLLHFLGPGAHHKPFFPSNMSSTLTTSWSLYLNKILGQKLGDSKAPHSSHNMMQENAPNPMASSLVRMFQTQAHNQQPMQRSMFQGCSPANPQREFMLCQGSSFVKHGALLDESKKELVQQAFWSLRLYHRMSLYHLESRWRNSHVLVYHSPLLSHLLGVTFTRVFSWTLEWSYTDATHDSWWSRCTQVSWKQTPNQESVARQCR